jgi:hypothetical protein
MGNCQCGITNQTLSRGNTDLIVKGDASIMNDAANAHKNGPYGTGPGFGTKGGGPVFGPDNMGQGSDLPVALSMLLMENPLAMQRFNAMSKEEKATVLKYVESGLSGEDAKHRIEQTVKNLKEGTTGFT